MLRRRIISSKGYKSIKPWVASVVFLTGSLVGQAQPSLQQSGAISLRLTITVNDRNGNYVIGLPRNAFTVLDGKQEMEITSFSTQDAPVSIAIVIDQSGSIYSLGKKHLNLVTRSLARFIQLGHRSNEYFVIGFKETPNVVLEGSRDWNQVIEALNKISALPAQGQSAVYDSCRLGIEKVLAGTHSKKAVVLISDGQDNTSKTSFNGLVRLIRENEVLLYSIGGNSREYYSSSLGAEGSAFLEELSKHSGGLSLFPNSEQNSEQMAEALEIVARDLHSQYNVAFRPAKSIQAGKCYSFKVRLKVMPNDPENKSLKVRSRESYCRSKI